MKENTILCGTRDELIEHFYRFTESSMDVLPDKTNLLICKEGLTKQIDDIVKLRAGVGLIYYMTVDKGSDNINLTLMNSYVHVTDPTPLNKSWQTKIESLSI